MKGIFAFTFFSMLLIFITTECPAQSKQAPVILGLEFGSTLSILPKDSPFDKLFALRTAPYLEFRIAKGLYGGLNYEMEIGSLNGVKITPIYGFGAHMRYFFPIFKNNPLAKSKIQAFSEGTVVALDHAVDYTSKISVRPLGAFSNINTQIGIGLSLRLFESLYLSGGYRLMFYTKGESFQGAPKLALEYHFGEKREKYEKPIKSENLNKPDKQPAFDISSFLDRVTLGTSLTYLPEAPEEGVSSQRFNEWTWNLNMAVSITSDIDFGIAALPIWTKKGTSIEKYLLTGFFVQYDFLRRFKGNRFFIETGYYRGNYCTCGDGDPHRSPNLTYVPIGGGYEAKLSKKFPLFLDLSVLFFQILNKLPNDKQYAYSQYVIGLNYHLYP